MKNSNHRRSFPFRTRPSVESLEPRRLLAITTVTFEEVSPQLEVADINVKTIGLAPRDLTVAGDNLFFTADDGIHGRELWKMDTTAAGAVLVKDIVDGQQSAFAAISSNFVTTAVLQDTLFFIAEDELGSIGLWKSDGTSNGTMLVKELPGRPTEMLDVNDKLFLSIGTSLWASDGSASGTSSIADLLYSPKYLTRVDSMLFFAALSLWKSDGTPGGTQLVKDVEAADLANMDGTLYFAGGTSRVGNGVEIWKSDGTSAGTVEVKDIAPGDAPVGPSGPLSSSPRDFTNVDGTVYFTVSGLRLPRLWTTDGTEQGTIPVSAEGGELFAFHDELYIQSPHGITRLGAGQPFTPELTHIRNLAFSEDAFYFTAGTENSGRELWKSDGTTTGTTQVADLNPGPSSSMSNEPSLVFGDSVFFAADDGVAGMELWKSNGTEAGTVVVYDHNKGEGSDPHHLTDVAATLYFTADDGVTPRIQLWAAAGPQAALLSALPEPQKSIDDPTYPGSTSVDLINLIAFDNELVFTHYFTYLWASANGQHEYELWKSDGTSEGTQLLQSSYYSFFIEELPDPGPLSQAVLDGTLYFEYGLYDGQSVTPLESEDFSDPAHFTAVGNKLFFSAVDPENGRELWITGDGFQTYEFLKDIRPGQINGILRPALDFQPQSTEMVEFHDMLIFTAGVERREFEPFVPELWRSDGTTEGTDRIATVEDRHLSHLTVVGDKLFFTSSEPEPKLWVSDGTEAGTVLVRQFERLGGDFLSWNGSLYFSADAGEGLELWRSDGTLVGTQLVADILPGEGSSAPSSFAAAGDKLFFAATNGDRGREVWVSNGTSNGTGIFADVFAGALSSDPLELTVIDDWLYFVADDGIRGRELWRAETDPPKVENIVIDDGTPQRSMVRTVSVEFDRTVTLDPGAIALETDEAVPEAVPFTLNTADEDGKTVATLTFSDDGGSLDDGKYRLTVDGDKVHVGSIYMGAAASESFFRLFGDKTGDGAVFFNDFLWFVNAFGSVLGDPNYDDDFDVDGSASIGFHDFLFLVRRFGTQL